MQFFLYCLVFIGFKPKTWLFLFLSYLFLEITSGSGSIEDMIAELGLSAFLQWKAQHFSILLQHKK